ncbi:MAG: tRNA 2-thiouridine(34) synthase MnmA [bacterium]
MKKNSQKVLVCMSGGVDSSVAATLLVDQSYDVTGAFMINYDQGDGQCWKPEYQDALRVSAKLGIQLLKLDFTEQYEKQVLEYMYKQYKAGRTPNPDVLCNKFIKFGVWLDKIKELGFNKMATGHYARTENGHLLLVKDRAKDQTYFLHQLNKKQLSQTIFPLGDHTKQEVRELAKKFDLPTAEKSESMGICFIGEVPMKEFLQKKIKPNPGDIVMNGSSEILGKHQGLAFYTIGQRHLNIHGLENQALYVLDKDQTKNQLIVGHEDDPLLYKTEIKTEKLHWISGQMPKFPLKCKVRLRHQQSLQDCTLDKNRLIKFTKPQRAITPGQFAVFYLKNQCLGGGVIK